MIRFEIDPTLVADAIREGRKLVVEIDPRIGRRKVTLGQPSPHYRKADAAALSPSPNRQG